MRDEKSNIERPLPPHEDALVRPEYGRPPGYPPVTPYGMEANGGYSYGNYGYGNEADGLHQVKEIWRKVRKHQWLIAFITLLVTTVVTVEVFRNKSLYQASTTVELEKENRTLFRAGDVVIEGEEAEAGFAVAAAMKTKIRLLQSRPLLEDVVVALELDKNQKFLDVTQRRSVWESVQTLQGLLLGNKKTMPAGTEAVASGTLPASALPTRTTAESNRLAPYVGVLGSNLTAAPVEDTRMLAISYQHTDPELATQIVNKLAEVFIYRSYKNKTKKYADTSGWLNSRTRDLQTRLQQAEQKLADFQARNNIFSADGGTTLTTGNMGRLNTEATRAETERMLKQTLYEQVMQGNVAQLPDAYTDTRTGELKVELGRLTTLAAQNSLKYGPDNPNTRNVKKQIEAVQKQIEESRTALADKLKADYERALRDEQALKNALARAKGEAVNQNQAAIQVGILKQEVETAKRLYDDFLNKTQQANLQEAEQHNGMQVIEPATVPGGPVGPHRLRVILIGLLLSLACGVALAFALEYFDNTVKTVDDVGRYMSLPTLAVIPALSGYRKPRLLPGKAPEAEGTALALSRNGQANGFHPAPLNDLISGNSRSLLAEAYRGLRTSVLLSAAGRPPKVILVTSGMPGEGKTTTTINTAVALAQLGVQVLIIDADLRRPSVHKAFGAEHNRGLSTYLSHGGELHQLIQPLSVPNLSLLACGPIPPNPAELVSSEKMKELLKLVSERYDHILIDSPPLINVTDPVILSTMVDGVLLVVHGGKSKRNIVARARRELANVGAKIFGVVLNNVNLKSEGYDDYYYARYYQSYGYHDEKAASSSGD
jgi:capsular exopolysaccharide synthesis family protein